MAKQLDAYWMPFTANRQFKAAPRLLVEAEGMYYKTMDGRRILDFTSGQMGDRYSRYNPYQYQRPGQYNADRNSGR